MDIPFLDVGASYRELKHELDDAVAGVLVSGHYLLGPQLEAFENEFAGAVGATEAVGVGSGLDALTIALRALGVGPGDEVLVPAHTFIATWLAVSATGALPVPVEPLEATANIDPDAARAAVGPRTKAILPVHLYGTPAEIEPLEALTRSAGLALVYDAAQAHGATYRSQALGAFGDAVAWSFYPSKNLGAFADAGAVTFRDPDLAARARRLRNYGSSTKYVHPEQGVNSRLDELQAAVLRVKLTHLDEWNRRRALVADTYTETLADQPVILPVVPPDRTSSRHLYVLRSPRRDALQRHLADQGVQTLVHYPIPPHRQAAYTDHADIRLPITELLAANVLSLPIGPHLGPDQVDQVVAAVRSFDP